VQASLSDQITIKGSKEKRCILNAYEKEFDSNNLDSIITRKKGKLKYSLPLDCWNCMRPSLNKYSRAEELTLHNVMTLVLKEYGALTYQELLHIHLLNTEFARMIPKLLCWLKVNFLPLQEP
jgi:hypothetical protein